MYKSVSVFGLCVALLWGCGQTGNQENTATTDSSQVVATVDGKEISVHRLNHVLAGKRFGSNQDIELAKRALLQGLIQEQLYYNQAIEIGLDRTPKAIAMLDAARRDMIASMYLNNMVSGFAAPSDSQIADFYHNNKRIFENRVVYSIKEISVPADALPADDIKAAVKAQGTMGKLFAWLNENGVDFNYARYSRGSDAISPSLLPEIAASTPGALTTLEFNDRILVLDVFKREEKPLPLGDVKANIAQQLQAASNRKQLKEKMDQMLGAANIQFFGAFAGESYDTLVKPNDNNGASDKADATPSPR